jgi:hypothetical protein
MNDPTPRHFPASPFGLMPADTCFQVRKAADE